MEIVVVRFHKKEKYTIGKMYINGTYFCDTLEDTDRGLTQEMNLDIIDKTKVYGKTAIPTGRYRVELTKSKKFGRVLPLLYNVKGFEGIRIHRGNTNEDTLGCILVGQNKAVGKVINSAMAEQNLMDRLKEVEKNELIYITVI